MDLSPDDDNFQGRLLHQAALWDNVDLLQELLVNGADVNARDALSRTALHAAALAERSNCLAALCAAGANLDTVSSPSTGGKTALHIAAERGHVENVRVLLTAGATLSTPDALGDTALTLAERHSHRHASAALREARDALERERISQHNLLRDLVTRGEAQLLKSKLAALGADAGLIVNLTPGGANTLLYIASESGHTLIMSYLLSAGADGRAHPVTKYCPLYIACYRGHFETAQLLLRHFPSAAQQETVEKWLPLHAACIGGNPALVNLLLQYPYPEDLLNTFTDSSNQRRYRAVFDVNACDARGQTALYIACTLGNADLVEALLSHTVSCWRPTQTEGESVDPPACAHVVSPARAGISLGIHAIVSRLTRQSSNNKHDDTEHQFRPVRVECGRSGDTCLSAAARGSHARVATLLLAAGADPDALAHPPHRTSAEYSRDSRRRSRASSALPGRSSTSPSPSRDGRTDRDVTWTPLAIAACTKNIQLLELMISHGASDPQCCALRECAKNALEGPAAKLLATKAFPDPDYKINKALISDTVFNGRDGDSTLTYNALCPTTPVTVNWRELRCQLAKIRMRWIEEAALRVNPKLCSPQAALHAVTRVDVSNNELRVLPPELFTLVSLRYLNAAQNKLERLPSLTDPFEEDIEVTSKGKKVKRSSSKKTRPAVYSAPVLQDLYLQDNRLEELPAALFCLPSLSTLDVSNNKLRSLPHELWSAPRLKDLNAAFNHLKDLPYKDETKPEVTSPTQLLTTSESSNQLSSSPSVGQITQFSFGSLAKGSSRSPSIERGVSETADADGDVIEIGNRSGNAVCTPVRRPHSWRGVVEPVPPPPLPGSHPSPPAAPLTVLNLAHNQFTRVPPALACRAPRLQRLSLAYNSLRSMSYVTSYPTSLRQLDLSHNEITCWPSLPQVEKLAGTGVSSDPLSCYCDPVTSPAPPPAPPSRRSAPPRDLLLAALCPARRHLALDSLRTLILANNLLTRIQLTTDDDGNMSEVREETAPDEEDEWNSSSSLKGRLLFPLLSMLDVSCNLLKAIPPTIHALNNLAVLNISGNKDITDLPPQMGLLSRLWNLNTQGCTLQEPLRSMVQSGKYRSMDIVGYLKSVLQEARPYTTCKLMFVGLQGIGKTSLLECLRQESALINRRKPTDHWAKRMGNKAGRRGNISTVGVDIGVWICDKQRSQRGPITFRTWDFGGQQEYYATHQYFLSKRSIYLVVWKVTDGKKGLAGAVQWLRSIQARAPGSPVIMVATHYDQVSNTNLPENESPEALQRLIRSSIMGAPDADKLGLPRVLDSLEVSCSTKHNIRLLVDIIYSIAYSVKPPGSKEPLLEQRVPATYLALEECVTHIANELKEPVLKHDEYKRLVTQYMQQRNLRMFRDAAELHQATMFLHDNGVLLHYDDATLKELYFLRPQWLCDVLAHVVTVREINPFAGNGIMKISDLPHVFKASPLLSGGEDAHSLRAALLNKFELALSWESRLLLVPPLLPASQPQAPQLPLRTRNWSSSNRGTPRRAWPLTALSTSQGETALHGTESPSLIHETPIPSITITARDSGRALRRLLLMSYVPCGFWPRLCTRLLSDEAVPDCAGLAYIAPHEMDLDEITTRALELNWSWKLWKTGLMLVCGDLTLASVRQLPSQYDELLADCRADEEDEEHPYSGVRFRIHQEGAWCELDAQSSACVEVTLPAEVCIARRDDGEPISGYQSISLEPNPTILTKLLALFSDHVDLLLEDWYPSLGTRFVHTSEGRCLITRLVPCPGCLREVPLQHQLMPDHHHQQLAQALNRLEMGGGDMPRRVRLSEESRASDGDSGVGGESIGSSLAGSVERARVTSRNVTTVTAWTHERCVLAACSGTVLRCDIHGTQPLSDIAPDTLLLDIEEEKRARWEEISRSEVVGRGAFGTVHAARWRSVRAALKALQPVQPTHQPSRHDNHAHKAAVSRWEREPAAAACRAYCALRQELTVLTSLRHPHVISLLAVCCAPLALLLPLAPLGALDGILGNYRSSGCRVGARAVRCLFLQTAKALEYLHAKRIVYRDLKSENVLVWSMPKPQEAASVEMNPAPINIHIKLGDYGISRLAPPSGTKGFGGTEGFMAPEIMRYNGEEEYNEKVDCFSFGMLLYEIISLRQPFEGHEAVKEAILDGARPTLTARELQYPCNILCIMRSCWSGRSSQRASSGALVSMAAAPELCSLLDAAATAHAPTAPPHLLCVSEGGLVGGSGGEVRGEAWQGGEARIHTTTISDTHYLNHYTVHIPADKSEAVTVTSMCRVGAHMWLGDTSGRILVYDVSTCKLLWMVKVQEAVGGAASPISALQYLPDLERVALALRCGRLFLVTSSQPEAEGSFVLTELGTATELCCLTAVPRPQGYEVWAGGDGLHTYCVTEGGVCGADTVRRGLEGGRVTLLTAAREEPYVVSYTDPGCVVYGWSVHQRSLISKLDCSKLVPCSESLQSISLEDRLGEDSCKITALGSLYSELYVGTAWGCIIVAEISTLRPITVFRPYESDVSAIIPLYPPKSSDKRARLMTLGTGYRTLLQRFVPQAQMNTNMNLSTGTFSLLWQPGHWLPD